LFASHHKHFQEAADLLGPECDGYFQKGWTLIGTRLRSQFAHCQKELQLHREFVGHCLFFLSVSPPVQDATRRFFCEELAQAVPQLTGELACDATGLLRATLQRQPQSLYLDTDHSESQHLQVTAIITSALPGPFQFDQMTLYVAGKDPSDFVFQASNITLEPGSNTAQLACLVTIPAGEYVIERITWRRGNLVVTQSLVDNTKYVLKVTENRSTLQVIVTEPDRSEHLSGMSISRHLRIYVYTNRESLKEGATLEIVATELNLPDQTCAVRILRSENTQEFALKGRAMALPVCGVNQVIEITVDAELTNVNKLEHTLSFCVRYSNLEGRAFTFTCDSPIMFTLPFEFASRVYYYDNQPFVGVLLKSLCEKPVRISGCEFDTTVLQKPELIVPARCPQGTPFPEVTLQPYQDFSVVYKVSFAAGREGEALALLEKLLYCLFHIEYRLLNDEVLVTDETSKTRITYPLEFSLYEIVGWYSVQLLPPVDVVTVGDVFRCEVEFSFDHVVGDKHPAYQQQGPGHSGDQSCLLFRLDVQINSAHWMTSGHRTKYFSSHVSLFFFLLLLLFFFRFPLVGLARFSPLVPPLSRST